MADRASVLPTTDDELASSLATLRERGSMAAIETHFSAHESDACHSTLAKTERVAVRTGDQP